MAELTVSQRTWMFQYHPADYDMHDFVDNHGVSDDWHASQNRRRMRIGDKVYILRAGGLEGAIRARIEAVGTLSSSVYFDGSDFQPYRIWVHYDNWITPPLTRQDIRNDVVLTKYGPLAKGYMGTNFLLPPEVAARTDEIVARRLKPITIGLASTYTDRPADKHQFVQDYQPAIERYTPPTLELIEVDPERIARSRRAHNELQNRLATRIRESGLTPLSPKQGGPNFDIAWMSTDGFYVAEIKSLTKENEESQLRLGLGQLLMYRHLLLQQYEPVKALFVVEREPSNPTWIDLCAELNVSLLWSAGLDRELDRLL